VSLRIDQARRPSSHTHSTFRVHRQPSSHSREPLDLSGLARDRASQPTDRPGDPLPLFNSTTSSSQSLAIVISTPRPRSSPTKLRDVSIVACGDTFLQFGSSRIYEPLDHHLPAWRPSFLHDGESVLFRTIPTPKRSFSTTTRTFTPASEHTSTGVGRGWGVWKTPNNAKQVTAICAKAFQAKAPSHDYPDHLASEAESSPVVATRCRQPIPSSLLPATTSVITR